MVIRRLLLAWLVAAAATVPFAHAQRPAKIPRVAFLGFDQQTQARRVEVFVQRLRELGYEEGRTIAFEFRWAQGRFDRLPALAAELVGLNPEVIVAAGAPARALREATTSIPVVVLVQDYAALGLASTLARPGGNVTGVAFQDSELSTKRLELLRQLVPGVSRVAAVWNETGGSATVMRALESAAQSLAIELRQWEVRGVADIAPVMAAAKAWGAGGVIPLTAPFLTLNRALLIDAAARNRLPMRCEFRLYVDDGCLATYSVSYEAAFRRMAAMVDRILRGERPETMPIEQPREFEFVINERTARALGLALPASLLLQATEVIR